MNKKLKLKILTIFKICVIIGNNLYLLRKGWSMELEYFTSAMLADCKISNNNGNPAVNDIQNMPFPLFAMIVSAAQGFATMIPDGCSYREAREIRCHINAFCHYALPNDGDEDKSFDDKTNDIFIQEDARPERVLEIVNLGEMDWQEIAEKRMNDTEWAMLGLDNLSIEQRRDLHRHAQAIIEFVRRYELDDEALLLMIRFVNIIRSGHNTYHRVQRAKLQLVEAYEDCDPYHRTGLQY